MKKTHRRTDLQAAYMYTYTSRSQNTFLVAQDLHLETVLFFCQLYHIVLLFRRSGSRIHLTSTRRSAALQPAHRRCNFVRGRGAGYSTSSPLKPAINYTTRRVRTGGTGT